jgi:hypothetical protein
VAVGLRPIWASPIHGGGFLVVVMYDVGGIVVVVY